MTARLGKLSVLGLGGLLLALLASEGCTRQFFRKAADREVDQVLAEKDKYPAWKIEQFHVHPDPRARFDSCNDFRNRNRSD